MTADAGWLSAVRDQCEPVFRAADAGFFAGRIESRALLWEADPLTFAARYPDSGVESSYGDSWPPPCLDYWVYLEGGAARVSLEGWDVPDVRVDLTGSVGIDGGQLARLFGRILGVRLPGW